MTTKLINEMTVDELGDALSTQMKASLDKRDVDLCTKIGAELDTKLETRFKELERKSAQFNIPGFGKEEAKRFSFGQLVKAAITGNWTDAKFEREACLAAAENKDMSAGTDALGGFIVPAQVLTDQIIPLLQARVIAFGLGVEQLTGLTGSPVPFTKDTAASTAYWVGESPSAGVTASDGAFGQLEMRPRTLAATCKMSNRLIRMSVPAADKYMQAKLQKDISLALDLSVFSGSGVSNQPRGILQTTGINTISSATAASASTTYNNLIDMMSEVDQDNALFGNLAWAMHPVVAREFQQMLDPTDGSQPKSRRLFDSQPINQNLLGYKFATSTQLTTNTLLFGDFSQCTVGFWTGMEMKISDVAGTNLDRLQTQVLIAMDVDIMVKQPTAFCAWTNMTGAP